VQRLPRIWLGIAFVSLAAGFALTFDPSFDDVTSTIVTLVPFVLLPTMVIAFKQFPTTGPSTALIVAAATSVVGWSVLVLEDDRWTVLTFALFGLCFSIGRGVGIALAGIVTSVWTFAWATTDGPDWRLLIPVASFGAGVVLWITLVRADDESAELALLVDQLRATQDDLAVSEREKGALEERARFAGEIHDTLAQGFTSIVLLSRASRRTADWETGLETIETVAANNLEAARRLVAAIGPAELEAASLPEALRRQTTTLGPGTTTHFDVVGTPSPLRGAVEIVLLRGLQEALLNVRTHASASTVHITLSYLGDVVVLDVSDDGDGFSQGTVAERGDLTGGQGLRALRHRVEALDGELTIESNIGGGSVISMQLPADLAPEDSS
jgi:signal transduction histidine kinase